MPQVLLGMSGMTLAVILVLGVLCASPLLPAPPARRQTAPQAASAPKPDAAPTPDNPTQDRPTLGRPTLARSTQDQGTPSPAQNPPTSSPSPLPAGTPAQISSDQTRTATTPRYHHQKRVLPPNCNLATAAAGQAPAGSTPGSSPPGSSPAQPDPAASKNAPVNCPPKKVIVRQGGMSEPSIQLAGGSQSDRKSHERDTANQMRESTQANLKKLAGHQLSPSQQDMV